MTPSDDPRLHFVDLAQPGARQATEQLAAVVAEGLAQRPKQLPCRYFYDAAGSALFERITCLPEYYLTRTEQSILQRHARDIVCAAGDDLRIVELGSGSSRKTRLLIEAALAGQARLEYLPIDISAEFLRDSAGALLREYDRLSVIAVAGEYLDALPALPAYDGPTLTLFLGSNIGNFEAREATRLLAAVRAGMSGDDRMLVGIDLVKDRELLLAAYNDSQGVTAAFNKNLLARINRQLGGRFDLAAFDHSAPYVEELARIEMRLVSRTRQTVPIAALDRAYDFLQGEYIHTENSHKYTLDSFAAICGPAGLAICDAWMDERRWFAVVLLAPARRIGKD